MNILIVTVVALGVACIVLAVLLTVCIYGWWKAEQECKQTRIAYWNERDGKIKEVDRLNKDLQGTRATIKARDLEMADLHAQNKSLDEDNACMAEANAAIAIERDKWQTLYDDLLTTYYAAQGDVHATVPLQVQEVAPEQVARYGTVLDAAKPVKRTRKKAGQQ